MSLFTCQEDDHRRGWKPAGILWNDYPILRFLLISDRCVAVVGGYVFGMLYSFGFCLVPLILMFVYSISEDQRRHVSPYLFSLSLTANQSVLAFLRQTYFYDSYASWAFIGGFISLFLVTITAISTSTLMCGSQSCVGEKELALLTLFQLGQMIHAAIVC